MKKTIFLTLLFVSSMAFAKTPYDICDGMFSSDDKITCLETLKGHQFDPAATQICADLFSSADQLSCLAVISDKDYLAQESKICAGLFSTDDKKSCLARVGSSTLCPGAEVAKSALENVLSLISSSNYRMAYSAANDLLEHFQACK